MSAGLPLCPPFIRPASVSELNEPLGFSPPWQSVQERARIGRISFLKESAAVVDLAVACLSTGTADRAGMPGSSASWTLKEEACGVVSSVNRSARVAHPVPAAEMN